MPARARQPKSEVTFLRTWIGRLDRFLMPRLGVYHPRRSLIFYDDHGQPSDRLFDLALAAIQNARTEDLSEISDRIAGPRRWPDVWPGDHYRLLAGIVRAMKPRVVIEIGTYQGLSALALAKNLPPGSSVHTFDVMPWKDIHGQTLRPADFEGGRIVFELGDLSDPAVIATHRVLLESADLLFVDAAKDGKMESVLLDRLEGVAFRSPPIVIFDDVRLWNMLPVWRSVTRPKLDLTSFGHWSGTGLIDWQPVGFEYLARRK